MQLKPEEGTHATLSLEHTSCRHCPHFHISPQAKQHPEAGRELGAAEDLRYRPRQREVATAGGGGLAEGARGGAAGREG